MFRRLLIGFGCALLGACNEAQSQKPSSVADSGAEVRRMVAENFTVKPGFVIANDPVLGGSYAVAWPAPFIVKCQLDSLSVSLGKQDRDGDYPVTVHLIISGTIADADCPAHVDFIGKHLLAGGSDGSSQAVSASRQ